MLVRYVTINKLPIEGTVIDHRLMFMLEACKIRYGQMIKSVRESSGSELMI